MLQCPLEERPITLLREGHEPIRAAMTHALKTLEDRLSRRFFGSERGKVCRQNPQALHQRKRQYEQHDHRYPFCSVSPLPGHKHHRCEEHHGTDHRKQDGLEDLSDPPIRRFITLHTPGLSRMNRFTDNNRIVHHNAEHQQECEQRDHVQADTRVRQQEKSAQKRYRNAHRHPNSNCRPEKQDQYQENQQQPAKAVFE